MRAIFALACSLSVAGCAIRPLPEHVTHVSTFDIVRQIRCETREAVFQTFIKALTKNTPELFDEATRNLAERLRTDPDGMRKLSPWRFKGDAREFLQFFWKTGVAYNFSLDMTEVNNVDAEINLLQSLAKSTRMFGFKAGVDRERQNIRTFTMTDDFSGLLNIEPEDYCDGLLAGANPIYPMAGKVGIELFIQEFVNISLFTNLASGDPEGGPPTMVDTLQFQTTVSGSFVPKVTFSPVGTRLNVADAGLTAEASRKDIHKLIMGLSVISSIGEDRRANGGKLLGRLVTATGTGKRRTAADAVDQEATRQALSKTTVIVRP